jgi:2-hydroxycyclohexanecarboxyl-CoA dehydrogenase
MRLEGKKALVTGGASGIGAAVAARLSAEGAEVWVGDINLPGAEKIADEVAGHAVELDVTDLEAARAAVAAVGAPDILVNNAGMDNFGFFVYVTQEQWRQVLDINLGGVMNCTHAALAGMQERGYGRIVNIASEAGRVGSKGSASYSAAKAGVIGFTKAIAREGAHYGVRANAVAPGPIETPLLEHMVETGDLGTRLRQGMIDSTLMRRPGTPDEVAATIAFLACDDASFITGQTIGVSGGLSLS